MVKAIESEFQTIGYAQLVIHFAQVILYNLLSCAHTECDFLVLHALSYAGNDDGFLRRQLNLRARSCWPSILIPVGFQHPVNSLAVKPTLPSCDLTQAVD